MAPTLLPKNQNVPPRFAGAPYPITKDPLGYFHTITSTRTIKSDLLCLLLTNPGERIMLPTFGTPLRSLVFEPNDQVLVSKARQLIVNAINTWEPRVNITSLDIQVLTPNQTILSNVQSQDAENCLSIRITFTDLNNLQAIDTLVLSVPLATGGG